MNLIQMQLIIMNNDSKHELLHFFFIVLLILFCVHRDVLDFSQHVVIY